MIKSFYKIAAGILAGAVCTGSGSISRTALQNAERMEAVRADVIDELYNINDALISNTIFGVNKYTVRGVVHNVYGSQVSLFDADNTLLQTVTPGKDGRFAFDEISVSDEAKLYSLIVIPGNIGGVEYDKNVYQFIVGNTETVSGKKVMKIVTADGSDLKSFDFWNETTQQAVLSEEATVFYASENPQTYVVSKTGTYKIEAWGAAGGDAVNAYGGRGEYVSGSLELKEGDVLVINAGGKGHTGDYVSEDGEGWKTVEGGFNGGGSGVIGNSAGNAGRACCAGSGGGMTDIWLNDTLLVAAGGGGGAYSTYFLDDALGLWYDCVFSSGGDGSGTGSASGGLGGQNGYGGDGGTGYLNDQMANTITYYGVNDGAGFAAVSYVPDREIYTVTFDTQGGNEISPMKVYCNDNIGALPNAYMEGKTFSGWFTAPEGGTRVRSDYIMPASNITLYAHYNEASAGVGDNGVYYMSGIVKGPADGEIQLYKADTAGNETMIEAVLPDENGTFTVSGEIDLKQTTTFVIRQKAGTMGAAYDESYFTVNVSKTENGGISFQNLKTDVEGNVNEVLVFEFVNMEQKKRTRGEAKNAAANHVIQVKWIGDTESSRAESVTLHILAGGITTINGRGADVAGNVDVLTVYDEASGNYYIVDTDIPQYAVYKKNGAYITEESELPAGAKYRAGTIIDGGIEINVFYQVDDHGDLIAPQFTDTVFEGTAEERALREKINSNSERIEALDEALGSE